MTWRLVLIFISIIAGLILNLSAAASTRDKPLSRDINKENVETFFDVAFETQKLEHELVGATIVVVKDGELIFKKGYGFADLDERIPVDPDKHLFRIASVSKTFTWTAVMQLVEQGKLDLEADIQTYLDFEIPQTYKEPIRLKNLLTHTPGFEDRGSGGFARSSNEVIPLADYLPANLPARVRSPGTFISYSNYGSAVAGYIVQRVSGVPWADYVQQNILDPLKMTATNIYQPMSEAHGKDHAKGYRYSAGQFKATDYWFEQETPAGVMSSTSADMARWLLLHLNEGNLDGISIIEPETARQMQSVLFRQHPEGQPVLHGFYRSDQNEIEVFGHGGDVNQFHSNMSIISEHNLGLFVSYNSDPASVARSNVVRSFINYFFPADYPEVIEPNPDVSLDEYTGTWSSTRRNHSTFERLALTINSLQINKAANELLLSFASGTSRWIPVQKDRFRAKYSNRYLLFYRDKNDRVSHFSFEGGIGSFEKIPWYESRQVNGLLFLFVAVVALVYLLRFAYLKILNGYVDSEISSLDRWIAAGTCIIMLFLIIRLAIGLTGDTDQFLYGVPTSLYFTFTVALFLLPLVVVVTTIGVRQWVLDQGRSIERLNYSLLVVSVLVLTYLMWFWNILGFYF